jgi:hypothetical protein
MFVKEGIQEGRHADRASYGVERDDVEIDVSYLREVDLRHYR